MKRNLLFIVLLSAGIFCTFSVNAQSVKDKAKDALENHNFGASENESNCSIHFGCALPIGEFGNISTPNSTVLGTHVLLNGASLGFSIGGRYLYRFENTGLEGLGHSIFLSADVFWNNMCKTYRNYYERYENKHSMYLNIPILLGYNYTHFFNDKVGVFGQAGAGIDLFFRTRDLISNNYQYYRMSYAFTAGFGAGVILGSHYSIALHCDFLGSQPIRVDGVTYSSTDNGSSSSTSGSTSSSSTSSTKEGYACKVSMSTLSLKLGYHF